MKALRFVCGKSILDTRRAILLATAEMWETRRRNRKVRWWLWRNPAGDDFIVTQSGNSQLVVRLLDQFLSRAYYTTCTRHLVPPEEAFPG